MERFEAGQMWRRKGPLRAVRLDRHELPHGQVGEGWYITVGDIARKQKRLKKCQAFYVPGADPVGPYWKLASLFSNPWAWDVAEEWESVAGAEEGDA